MSIVSVLCRPSDRSLNRSLNRNADGTAGGIERRYVTLRSIGMSLFTKKEEPAQENVKSKAAQPTSGKGRPTPKRKDAQAQNLRPLVPKDRDASRKAAKARIRERENAEYDAMQSGDINHMPKSERLPWRIYIRDYVDARFNLGERPYTEDLLGLPVVNIRHVPLTNTFNAVVKRLMDIFGSVVAIILFSPIMLFAVIMIKLTSPGPLIYKQERVGLHNHTFMMYKFRSMEVRRGCFAPAPRRAEAAAARRSHPGSPDCRSCICRCRRLCRCYPAHSPD